MKFLLVFLVLQSSFKRVHLVIGQMLSLEFLNIFSAVMISIGVGFGYHINFKSPKVALLITFYVKTSRQDPV